ncbi:hypothetical protein JKP88DRAFT_201663 [Tribonema minus]|uniref:Uncharacterized protein n=1 Tax=Tribonema minus TaxID=303371 RepID=A0A836CAC4_9STRA|nr:hypothetical protein JKP88DRAFT_201663 [Tribonema minus]
MYDEDDVPVLQLTESELAAIDADALELEMARLDGMLYELGRAPAEMRPAILREYADVLLDPYYVLAMRARVPRLETEAQRALLQAVNAQATTLVGQLAGLKQAQEVQELEKIRAICETAMDDMARLPDKVRSMKPLLNADFVAYLAYAIEKERGALRAKGMDPDREPSRWLQVLGVIKQGVFAELEKDVYLDVQAIHYVLRMREPDERRALLEATIATLPSMDVRGFRRVARNIAEHVAARSDGAVDAALRARVAEFAELMDELLPDARVEALSREADDWAAQRVADRDAVRRAVARARPNPSAFGGGTFSETYGADGSEDYGGGAAAALLGPETAPEAAPVTAETVAAAAAGAVDLTELYRQQSVEGEDAFGDGAGEEWGLWDEGEVDGSVVGGNRGEAVPGMLGGARFGTGGDEQQTSGSDGRVLTDEFGDELDDDASSW